MRAKFILLILIGLIFGLYQITNRTTVVSYKDYAWQMERADTTVLRERGLMGREGLANNEGMLFVFPIDSRPTFWMKKTLVSLDIIWLDKEKTVVGWDENLPPDPCGLDKCEMEPVQIQPNQDIRYVLEVKAGTVKKFNIKEGEKFSW